MRTGETYIVEREDRRRGTNLGTPCMYVRTLGNQGEEGGKSYILQIVPMPVHDKELTPAKVLC